MAWKRFVVDWNSTLNRAPQNVVSTFLFTQSSTWLLLFKSLSASSLAASLPPELAVGWLAARLTKKFRQPVNVALGAAVVQVAPSVADLKVTPLLTGAVSSPELATQVSEKRAQLEKAFPFLKPGIAGAVSAGQWLQGPVDKYGLALYLSGRVTGLATLLGVTGVVKLGVDVPALLAQWGLSDPTSSAVVGGTVASLAAASAANALCVPLHFGAAVYGTHLQEQVARAAADSEASAKGWTHRQEYQRRKRQEREGDENRGTTEKAQSKSEQFSEGRDSEEDEDPRAKHQELIMGGFSTVLLLVSMGISMYGLKLMASTGAEALATASAATPVADEKKATQEGTAEGGERNLFSEPGAGPNSFKDDSDNDATPPVAPAGAVESDGHESRTSANSCSFVK